MKWLLPGGELQALPSNSEAVVLLLDISGSMLFHDYLPSRIEAMKNAACKFIKQKYQDSPADKIGIVTFGSLARSCCALTTVGTGCDILCDSVHSIKSEGCTNIAEGIKKAGRVLKGGVFSQRRLILLSDGSHTEGGNPIKPASALKLDGVIIECVGIGKRNALDEDTLQKIASIHQGEPLYRWIGDREHMEKHFIEMSNRLVVSEEDNS